MDINSKGNVKVLVKFELFYFEGVVKRFSHYATKTVLELFGRFKEMLSETDCRKMHCITFLAYAKKITKKKENRIKDVR